MYNIFFFNDTATTEIYPLSLHDALPICTLGRNWRSDEPVLTGLATVLGEAALGDPRIVVRPVAAQHGGRRLRSEEHTSELQSRQYLVCRLLLEKKTKICSSSLQSSYMSA